MIQNCNNYRVLKVFLDNPTKGFGLREISRKIKLGLPSVSNYIKELKKESLILEKKVNEIRLWIANREKEKFKKRKIADKLIEIEDSGMLDFLDEKLSFPCVILFGSCSLGEDIETSDIDLCILSEIKKEPDLKEFEKYLNKGIQIFLFDKRGFQKLKDKNKELYNNIINGIVLRGRLNG